jgi:hypothetical protein
MASAEDVFSETFGRFMKNWAFISSLRQVADVAFPVAEQALAEMHTRFVERVAADPQYKRIIVKLDGGETDWGQEIESFIQQGMTDSAIKNARSAIDGASLVFAQSILDDCAWSYLRVCSIAAPADWDAIIKDKRIEFTSVVNKSADVIREELIHKKLDQLERDSLLNKVDLIFQLCTPPRDFAPINNYAYDKDRLLAIDKARQAIIHRDGMGKPIPKIEEDLEYISKTANFLMGLVNNKYGVQLNVIKVMNLPIPPEA